MTGLVFSRVSSGKQYRSASLTALCLGLLIGFGVVTTETGCVGALGTECTLTSDCIVGLHCVLGMCVMPCQADADCNTDNFSGICISAPLAEDDELRATGATEVNACHRPEKCGDANDGGMCMDGQICQDGRCWRECSAQEPCPTGSICAAGACHPETEVADGGSLPQSKVGEYCEINSDCMTMLCGMGGTCRKCLADGDCFSGATCLAGSCVGEGGYHGPDGTGGVSASSGWIGGGTGNYKDCYECTHVNTGAYWHQCDAERGACQANSICDAMLACSLNGLQSWPGGQTTKPPCTTNAEGAACTIECVDFYKNQDAQAATLYYQLDACVYCATCSTLCEDDTVSAMNYCNGICAAPEANCQ